MHKNAQSKVRRTLFFKYLSILLFNSLKWFSCSVSSPVRLELNYLHIAKSALVCEAYFTAILYGEMESYHANTDGRNAAEIKFIIKNAYQSIGESDAVSAYLDPIQQKTEYLEMNQSWNELLIGMDVHSNDFAQRNKYLGQAGLYNLANQLSQTDNAANYACAWRLADWSIVEGNAENISIELDKFEKYHYFALKYLDCHDQIGVQENVKKAYEIIIKRFKQCSYECTKNIYTNLKMLQLLQQIEEFCYVRAFFRC